MSPADSSTTWSMDDDADVRLYTLTGGRTRPRHLLQMDSVLAAGPGKAAGGTGPEAAQVLALCQRRRRSIAELSGRIGQPVTVVKVLVSDLIDTRALVLPVTTPFVDSPSGPRPSRELLEAVSAGLRNLWPDAQSRAV